MADNFRPFSQSGGVDPGAGPGGQWSAPWAALSAFAKSLGWGAALDALAAVRTSDPARFDRAITAAAEAYAQASGAPLSQIAQAPVFRMLLGALMMQGRFEMANTVQSILARAADAGGPPHTHTAAHAMTKRLRCIACNNPLTTGGYQIDVAVRACDPAGAPLQAPFIDSAGARTVHICNACAPLTNRISAEDAGGVHGLTEEAGWTRVYIRLRNLTDGRRAAARR